MDRTSFTALIMYVLVIRLQVSSIHKSVDLHFFSRMYTFHTTNVHSYDVGIYFHDKNAQIVNKIIPLHLHHFHNNLACSS